jgi:hypothetical protein
MYKTAATIDRIRRRRRSRNRKEIVTTIAAIPNRISVICQVLVLDALAKPPTVS